MPFPFWTSNLAKNNKPWLKDKIHTDLNFRKCVVLVTTLALIPESDIDSCWLIIKDLLIDDSWQIQIFIDYVERVWLSDVRPLFRRHVWSQHGVLRGRTNNYAESMHSKLNRSLNKSHPNFYEVVDKIKGIQLSSSLECLSLVNGEPPRPRKKIHVLQDRKIETLCNNYNNRIITLGKFMDGLRGAIKFNM
jgi:hypothetical protein